MYGEPSGSVVAVCHARKPQPCLAVSTALETPSARKLSTQFDTFRFVGAKLFGSLELQPPLLSQPRQLFASQPGSPSWKKAANGGVRVGYFRRVAGGLVSGWRARWVGFLRWWYLLAMPKWISAFIEPW